MGDLNPLLQANRRRDVRAESARVWNADGAGGRGGSVPVHVRVIAGRTRSADADDADGFDRTESGAGWIEDDGAAAAARAHGLNVRRLRLRKPNRLDCEAASGGTVTRFTHASTEH